jgi:hypothetical protein
MNLIDLQGNRVKRIKNLEKPSFWGKMTLVPSKKNSNSPAGAFFSGENV